MDNLATISKMILHIEKIQEYIHDYDGINLKVVWETITEDLPVLATQLKKII